MLRSVLVMFTWALFPCLGFWIAKTDFVFPFLSSSNLFFQNLALYILSGISLWIVFNAPNQTRADRLLSFALCFLPILAFAFSGPQNLLAPHPLRIPNESLYAFTLSVWGILWMYWWAYETSQAEKGRTFDPNRVGRTMAFTLANLFSMILLQDFTQAIFPILALTIPEFALRR